MALVAYPLPQPLPDNASFGQMIFLPTRSLIKQFSIQPTTDFTPLGNGPFLFSFKRNAHVDVVASSVLADVFGEPLRLAGVIWHEDANQMLDQNTFLLDWVEQRKAGALLDPRRWFFVDLDLGSIPDILKIIETPEICNERMEAIQIVGQLLEDRIEQRANPLIEDVTISNPPSGDLHHFQKVKDFLESLYECHHPGGVPPERDTGLAFAAGWLRHDCVPSDSRLNPYTACDADSANIFLFTELALIFADMDGGWDSPWAERANTFACMQAIYLERWETRSGNPWCFKKYDATAKPLENSPGHIVDLYDQIRDYGDKDALLREIRGMVRRTAKYPGCFKF